eukprot:ANDGO_07673.mRNA.1 Protein STABILIZED1
MSVSRPANTIYGYKAFLDMPAPPNYVAGLGRGAIGFSTRADLGAGLLDGDNEWGGADAGSRRASRWGDGQEYDDDYVDVDVDVDGVSGGVSGVGGAYKSRHHNAAEEISVSRVEEEASAVMSSVEQLMQGRRKKLKAGQVSKAGSGGSSKGSKSVKEMFADVKGDLQAMTAEEWMQLPESSGSLVSLDTNKFHAYRQERPSVASSFLLTQTPSLKGALGIGAPSSMPSVNDTRMPDTAIPVSGHRDYEEVKRLRLLYRSLTTTNPSFADGWIAYAGLEEKEGRVSESLSIWEKGASVGVVSEKFWTSYFNFLVRHPSSKVSKAHLLQTALSYCPQAVDLWISLASLQKDRNAVRTVLQTAIDENPSSVKLWKAAVDAESDSPEDAKLLLKHAVSVLPGQAEFWIALSKLSTHSEGRKLLNEARKCVPGDPRIWIAACQLEDSMSSPIEIISKIAMRAVGSLRNSVDRRAWLELAVECERSGSIKAAECIAAAVVRDFLVETVHKKDHVSLSLLILEDVQFVRESGTKFGITGTVTCRTVYKTASEAVRDSEAFWVSWLQFEESEKHELLQHEVLRMACRAVPGSAQFSVKLIGFHQSRAEYGEIVSVVFEALKNSADNSAVERIAKAAVSALCVKGAWGEIECILSRLRIDLRECAWVWEMAVAVHHMKNPNSSEYDDMLNHCVSQFAGVRALKFVVLRVEDLIRHDQMVLAMDVATSFLNTVARMRESERKELHEAVAFRELLHEYIRLELSAGQRHIQQTIVKTRTFLERLRLQIPNCVILTIFSAQLERAMGSPRIGEAILARAAKQQSLFDGRLWALSLAFQPRAQRRSICMEGLKKHPSDPYVPLLCGLLFWEDGLIDKALEWFIKTSTAHPAFGDAWMCLYIILTSEYRKGRAFPALSSSVVASVERCISDCMRALPTFGFWWDVFYRGTRHCGIDSCSLSTHDILQKCQQVWEQADVSDKAVQYCFHGPDAVKNST